MNSSRRTSPGSVRMRAVACASVMIDDLDPFGAPAPHKADAALRLARYFGGSAAVWLRLQVAYDLSPAELPQKVD